MTRKQKRLAVIGGGVAVIALAVILVLFALSRSVSYFFMPSDFNTATIGPDTRIRLGGLVEEGSVERNKGTDVKFAVTDGSASVTVVYSGILPDLFREGQGVVTEGRMGADGVFVAETVLAKHDENYMPKEVADRLKAEGVWEGEDGGKP
ncbi:cytochrome c maturation protein CcmE [Martelella limonii]|uniref:cytochrome c maturation protein CcmE n=1 Tax=Martelella limonii TaxID=1647649 RepID=UPI00158052C4|nr:cytochrome c maturation protein CcmE [Martelella limonii]